MSLFLLALLSLLLLGLGYLVYGKILSKAFGLNNKNVTPACLVNDGLDYVPAKAPLLMGQHFSAITAAGPIVGPILAGLYFGWLPAILWIVFGAIFIGATHDFAALVSSVRHKGHSIAKVVKEHTGQRAYVFFMLFIWLSLVYVITAFCDITSSTFSQPPYGGGVATSSMIYLLIGLTMGLCLYKFKMPLWLATIIFVPMVIIVIWYGQKIPIIFPESWNPHMIWNFIILGYCFIASIIPVWLLLQSRGYLGGFFLYAALGAGVFGLFFGGHTIEYPAFIGFFNSDGVPLFPILFVTIACGACSGFHGLVSSGTTSKQIKQEKDCRPIGYGSMLLEGLVAIIALATVMLFPFGAEELNQPPGQIYANGLASFVAQLGINREFALTFALLAFATFIYDTLDVATRLGRYILQELTGWKGTFGRITATFITLALPAWGVTMTVTDSAGKVIPAWRVLWVTFGASNQLLAALTLLGVALWLKKTGKKWTYCLLPTIFMMVITFIALGLIIKPSFISLLHGHFDFNLASTLAVALVILALLIIVESFRSFKVEKPESI